MKPRFAFVIRRLGLVAALLVGPPQAEAATANPGDVIVTEIHQNPAAVLDSAGEWFEVFNTTTTPIDLEGWTIENDDIDVHVIAHGAPLIVPAQGYLVLGIEVDPQLNGGASVDYGYGNGWFLANGADEIVLRDTAQTRIDRVAYDGGIQFPEPNGASMALRDTALDNDVGSNWCESTTPFGSGDLGTPGAANDCESGGPAERTLMEIQGAGATSPFVGQTVRTGGIVVCDFQQNDQLLGFFLQAEQGDANPQTSDGIFVFDPGGTPVGVGDRVTLVAEVAEFHTLTELVAVQSLAVTGTGQIAPTAVDLPETIDGELERYEGMWIELTAPMTLSQLFFLDRYGQITLASSDDGGVPGRLFQPTERFNPTTEASAVAARVDENRRRLLVLDDARDINALGDNPLPVPYLGPAPPRVLRAGDSVSNLIGCLDYGRIDSGRGSNTARDYRLQPTAVPSFSSAGPRPQVRQEVGGRLTVASFNVLNYFNGDGLGGGFPTSRGASTAQEFTRQRDKIVSALAALDADVVGLIEIENDGYGPHSAIRDLVGALNASVGAGTWTFVQPPPAELEPDGTLGGDEIAVAFLYRPSQVTPAGDARVLRTGAFDPGLADGGRSRVPLAQAFTENATLETFVAVVNHLKSKASSGNPSGANVDQGDGQGAWNERRTEAAQDLAAWLLADPTGSDDADVLILGDLNAYGAEDPIAALTGSGYVDLFPSFSADPAYSFIFDGQAGRLDHALASASAASQVTGVTAWHINTDEPEALSYDEDNNPPGYYDVGPFRSSDHDPIVVGLDLALDPEGDAATVCLPSGSGFTVDVETPGPGQLFSCLAQALNDCPGALGSGCLGEDSPGVPRAGTCAP